MDTPICDFVRQYAADAPLRLHMPGHKGHGPLGVEALDITEVEGADVLYQPTGIIRRSQENAAALFGTAKTVYSTEGSSLCIRGMVCLASLYAKSVGRPPVIAAGRNAHRVFMTAAALLDVTVDWLMPAEGDSLLSCTVTGDTLEAYLAAAEPKPVAVYITSPDYLGNRADIAALATVCHRHDVLLLVDNAHGAYLHFLPKPCHPLDEGADLCCDSAHKTLGVLTGGAYLHIGKDAPALLAQQATEAMALFASTSPSYLILQSLDAANPRLAGDYPAHLAACTTRLDALKATLTHAGWPLIGNEPLKLTLAPKIYGYTGEQLAAQLAEQHIHCECSDPDYVVCMVTPEGGDEAIDRLEAALLAIPAREPIRTLPPPLPLPKRRLSPRQALLSPGEELPVEACIGRILATPAVSCPPAVPIAVCGEVITEETVALLTYYGITHCRVI
ncbi:MAG: aminotransferase class I/II-fold pyridoxal phosphate-dependent enzyme [Clostridia bacterium]|nr:aminotransferase class I/II-fold pyridoxal phosphate-dependent enzyme [Clostridia bacterium]